MTTVCAMAPKASSPPPPIPPRPVGGGSILPSVQVPEKFAFGWVLTITGRARTSAIANSTIRFIIFVSSLRRCFRHERLRPEDMRRIRPRPRSELLRAPSEDLRGVQVAIRIGREFMHRPEQARSRAVRSPGIEQLSVQVV